VEDGWLVEMYYRAAVRYQADVFVAAEDELSQVARRLEDLDESRFSSLHQMLLSFVPRQRRLFSALPDQFKGVLDNLAGLRIDEDTLQMLINDMIKERSYDHLKRAASHRSSIMNRSRLNTENDDAEVEKIDSQFLEDPMKSPMVVLSKVVGFQVRGLVNASWKSVLVVVTLDGNLVLLSLPDNVKTGSNPVAAFQSLRPSYRFENVSDWTTTTDVSKILSPTMILSLAYSTFSVPNKGQGNQVQIVEEYRASPTNGSGGAGGGVGGGRSFMRAVRAAAETQFSKKSCTLSLSSGEEATEWIELLERTKNAIALRESSSISVGTSGSNSPRKRFAAF